MPTLTDWQFSIAGLTLGPGLAYNVTGIGGLPGKDELRANDVPRPLKHGLDAGTDLMGGRHVTLEVYIDGGGNPDAAIALMYALVAAWFVPDTDIEPTRPLSFKLPGMATQQLRGRPRKCEPSLEIVKSGKGRMTLEYVGTDPFIYSDQLNVLTMALQQITGGRAYNRVYPMTYGTASAGAYTVTNAGSVATAPAVRITGPVDNPVIENLTTGEQMRLNISIAAGDYVDIDFEGHTILLNGTASRYSTKDDASAWWVLAPGVSNIRYRADTFQAGSSCTLSWRDAWL